MTNIEIKIIDQEFLDWLEKTKIRSINVIFDLKKLNKKNTFIRANNKKFSLEEIEKKLNKTVFSISVD